MQYKVRPSLTFLLIGIAQVIKTCRVGESYTVFAHHTIRQEKQHWRGLLNVQCSRYNNHQKFGHAVGTSHMPPFIHSIVLLIDHRKMRTYGFPTAVGALKVQSRSSRNLAANPESLITPRIASDPARGRPRSS